jgi:hypothetical protein
VFPRFELLFLVRGDIAGRYYVQDFAAHGQHFVLSQLPGIAKNPLASLAVYLVMSAVEVLPARGLAMACWWIDGTYFNLEMVDQDLIAHTS